MSSDAELKKDPVQQASLESLAQQLIASDPEAMERVERVSAAAQRVAELQAEQARLAAAIAEEAGPDAAQLRERQAVLAANSSVAEAEVRAAELLLQAAALEAEQAEAERQLFAAEDNQDADRVESGKAAAAAGIGGVLGSLPYLLVGAGSAERLALGLAEATASSVLFGVTYRYAVRTDLNNTQLKAGVVAAFGLVRGIAAGSQILVGASSNSDGVVPMLESLAEAALVAGQSMLTFAFASAVLEVAFRQGWVQPLRRG